MFWPSASVTGGQLRSRARQGPGPCQGSAMQGMGQSQERLLDAPASAASLVGAPCLLSRCPWPDWLPVRAQGVLHHPAQAVL